MADETFIPYGSQWIDDDDIEAVSDAMGSGWLTTGPRVNAFEDGLSAFCGTGHAVAVSSGTAALHTAYFGAGLGPGDEIITSPLPAAIPGMPLERLDAAGVAGGSSEVTIGDVDEGQASP